MTVNEKPTKTENYPEKKSGGMYSSMIVGKNEEYKKPSGLASGDKIK
jgi:hypothetical protein